MSIKLFFSANPKMVLITFACALILNCVKLQAQSKLWLTPAEFSKLKNPVTVDPVSTKNGKTLYTSYCTPCHGDKGKGDGAAAAALNPKPADHTSPVMLKETDGSLFYKISEGRTPMPQYKAILTDNQRWDFVNYVRTLCKTSPK